jgi:hypothetical protein
MNDSKLRIEKAIDAFETEVRLKDPQDDVYYHRLLKEIRDAVEGWLLEGAETGGTIYEEADRIAKDWLEEWNDPYYAPFGINRQDTSAPAPGRPGSELRGDHPASEETDQVPEELPDRHHRTG